MADPSPFFLILASGSPRRKDLLADLNLEFKIIPTEIPEIPCPEETARSFSRRMARRKTELVSSFYPHNWVLGADTVVVLEKQIFGKPEHSRQAKKFLQSLSGKTHQVITSFCLLNRAEKKTVTVSVSTRVTFKSLSAQEINWYIRTGEPLDKAGAYAIQGKGAFCVEKIQGSYTNVVGLPVTEVLEALKKHAGLRLL
jgi:septum formation protein